MESRPRVAGRLSPCRRGNCRDSRPRPPKYHPTHFLHHFQSAFLTNQPGRLAFSFSFGTGATDRPEEMTGFVWLYVRK
ncbi:MAG: hypothetical protein MUF18_21845 [Fimbriiglobus sp.]|nr:hypothetical protein [Fimbriiglobus sp.]